MIHSSGHLVLRIVSLPEVAPRTRPMSLLVNMAGFRLGHERLHQAPPAQCAYGRDGLQHCAGPYARPLQRHGIGEPRFKACFARACSCTVERAPDMLLGQVGSCLHS